MDGWIDGSVDGCVCVRALSAAQRHMPGMPEGLREVRTRTRTHGQLLWCCYGAVAKPCWLAAVPPHLAMVHPCSCVQVFCFSGLNAVELLAGQHPTLQEDQQLERWACRQLLAMPLATANASNQVVWPGCPCFGAAGSG
jgi:hypothetical protein